MASDEQKLTLELFAEGKNVIILGPGGTGKTYIIKKIAEYCEKKRININVAAYTGKAASLFNNGRTVNSLFGIGLGNKTAEEYIKEIKGDKKEGLKGNKWKLNTWRKLRIVVIDEISMLGMSLFDKLDKIARSVRNCNKPFGGIQIIGSGDFLQLPPVKDEYCFHSKRFDELFPLSSRINYTSIFRQKDIEFKTALSEIRIGQPSPKTIQLFADRVGKDWKEDGLCVEPLHIFPLKRDVRKWNAAKLTELKTSEVRNRYIWKPAEHWSESKSEFMLRDLLRTAPIEENLVMKVGASVMHTINNRNIDKFNGSTGEIIEFTSVGDPVVRFTDGTVHPIYKHKWETFDKLGALEQYPLIVAWAVTVHKIQGSELDAAQIDVGENIFEYNQIYVALSRVKTIKGIYLSAFDPDSICAHPDALDFYDIDKQLESIENGKKQDVVKELCEDIKNIEIS